MVLAPRKGLYGLLMLCGVRGRRERMGERGHVTLQKPREFPLFQRGSPDSRGSRGIPVKAMKTNVLPRER